MKTAAYILFAIMYYAGCIFPADKNRYFCVMTHDGSDDSSVGVVVQQIRKLNSDAVFSYVKKSDRSNLSLVKLIFVKSVQMARSCTVLMDNEFLPLSYVKPRKGTKVVQLWHGTGTIKKFGHDINEGRMLKLVERADSRITHLIVNSDYTGNLYKKAFGVTEDKVYITGIPRTDVLFDEQIRKKDINAFFNEYPDLKGRKLILYAPTFRDSEVKSPKLMLDIDEWIHNTDRDTILLLRLHPHVSKSFDDNMLIGYEDRVVNVSDYADLNTLLFVSSSLITDYSSIIFEYIILDRPLYFYAYDLDAFKNNDRGFYEDYESYVPGPVVNSTRELAEAVSSEDRYKEIRKSFRDKFYKYTDGHSTDRLIGLLQK